MLKVRSELLHKVIAPELRHLGVVNVENTVGTVGDRESRIETSIPDIPRFTGPTRALVHGRLDGFPQLVISPRRVEPLLEKCQGTAGSHMTTGIMGPLEERQGFCR